MMSPDLTRRRALPGAFLPSRTRGSSTRKVRFETLDTSIRGTQSQALAAGQPSPSCRRCPQWKSSASALSQQGSDPVQGVVGLSVESLNFRQDLHGWTDCI